MLQRNTACSRGSCSRAGGLSPDQRRIRLMFERGRTSRVRRRDHALDWRHSSVLWCCGSSAWGEESDPRSDPVGARSFSGTSAPGSHASRVSFVFQRKEKKRESRFLMHARPLCCVGVLALCGTSLLVSDGARKWAQKRGFDVAQGASGCYFPLPSFDLEIVTSVFCSNRLAAGRLPCHRIETKKMATIC